MEQALLLLELGGIIIAAKLIVSLCMRFHVAPVFGMVLLGIFLGKGVTGLVHENEIIKFVGSIGVMMLLFIAGLETDIPTMKKTGKASFWGAVGGVSLPLIAGYLLCRLFGHPDKNCYFTGTILTATSVSVTVMTLWEMGKLKSKLGATIISAAIIDDIMGLVVLVLVLSSFCGQGNAALSLGKAMGFLGIGSLVGFYLLPKAAQWVGRLEAPQISLSFAFSAMFLYGGIAELCEIAPITGAYMAGLFISRLSIKPMVLKETEVITQSFFIPIFFANIGLLANFDGISEHAGFIVSFVLIACVCKIVGSGIASKLCGFSIRESLCMGIGMMPRGEVALVIATIGISAGLIGQLEFTCTILLVVFSAIVTPVLLKAFFPPEVKRNTAEMALQERSARPE